MEFTISKAWNGNEVTHAPVKLSLTACSDGLRINIVAPYFNDPGNPGGEPGKPFDELWDYEVVEVFFLNSENDEYLEVEFCPHGQHQIIALKGRRKPFTSNIELDSFTSEIKGTTWHGVATVPWGYFPTKVDKLNAYAIHGSHEQRQYEALYPADDSHSSPDFHRLEYFGQFVLSTPQEHEMRSPAIWGE